MKTMKTMKTVRKSDIKPGYWARTIWDGVGAKDGLLLENQGDGDWLIYYPTDKTTTRVVDTQITKIGTELSTTFYLDDDPTNTIFLTGLD